MPKKGFEVITVRLYAYEILKKYVNEANKGKLPGKKISRSMVATDAVRFYVDLLRKGLVEDGHLVLEPEVAALVEKYRTKDKVLA